MVTDSGFPDLQRFVEAQDSGGTYATALAELRRGRKRSHWMWFVFPQIAGLGQSPTAVHYGVRGLDEARAYLAHPVLDHGWSSAPTRSPASTQPTRSTSSAASTRSSCVPR